MDTGYIRLWRKIDSWYLRDKPDYLSVWVYCLTHATHREYKTTFGRGTNPITLKPGQFIAGRHQISKVTGVNSNSVKNIINRLILDNQLTSESFTQGTVFTILNWEMYQPLTNELDNERPTKDQRKTTKQEHKNNRTIEQRPKKHSPGNGRDIPYQEIIEDLNLLIGSNYRHSSSKTQSLIRARWNEGFRVDEFKKVHRIKAYDWINTDHAKYLRPETLYGTKFEGYLNQQMRDTKLTDKGWKTLAIMEDWLKERGEGNVE